MLLFKTSLYPAAEL